MRSLGYRQKLEENLHTDFAGPSFQGFFPLISSPELQALISQLSESLLSA